MKLFAKCVSLTCLALLISFSVPLLTSPAHAVGLTYTVNTTIDDPDFNVSDGICDSTASSGVCTLRAAIEQANFDNIIESQIFFNIPGSGVQTIVLDDVLPTVLVETLLVDGYTQPGSQQNTAVSPNPLNSVITIEIDASNSNSNGFASDGIGTILRGVSIHSCIEACALFLGDGAVVEGNYLGVDSTGLDTRTPSKFGLAIAAATGFTIGGTQPEDRNVLAGSDINIPDSYGTILFGASNGVVYGNYFGIGPDGTTDLNVEYGLFMLLSSEVQVGGAGVGEANLASGGRLNQIDFSYSGNIYVQGNIVGLDGTGNANASLTSGTGILAYSTTSGSVIGGPNPGEGNVVVGAEGLAISVFDSTDPVSGDQATTNVAVLGNSIYDVGVFDYPGFGDSNQGIDLFTINYNNGVLVDLSNQGVTPNDVGDVDGGPNGHINFPVLLSAIQIGSQLTIHFDLDAFDSTSGDYRVEFFSSDDATIFGHGPGQTFLGAVTEQNGLDNIAVLTLPPLVVVSGKYLSATVTSENSATASGFGSTSEFSQNILIGSTLDSDADSVNDVIEDAGPNGGDANNDSIADSLQPTVTTYVAATSGEYTTFITTGCSANGHVTAIAESAIGVTDTGYQYPYGLTDFLLACSRGDSVTVDKYIFTSSTDLTGRSVRKYRPNTSSYEAVPGSTVTSVTIAGNHAIHLNYVVTDGSAQDDDGLENGVIVDPVGLALVLTSATTITTPSSTTINGNLPATGKDDISLQVKFSAFLLGLGTVLMWMSFFARKKNQLVAISLQRENYCDRR